ncbi:MAG: hypothetical protein HUJ61_04390 [Bacilli bacterium]|nr:hypothetical protein [Bacilli bacterium]
MLDFLKKCGYGALTIVLAPFVAILFSLYAVYALGIFLFEFFRIMFIDIRNLFTRKAFINPFEELEEEKKAKQILTQMEFKETNPNPVPQGSVVYQQNFYGTVPPNMNPLPNVPPTGYPNNNYNQAQYMNNPNQIPNNQSQQYNQIPNSTAFPFVNNNPNNMSTPTGIPGNNVINPDGSPHFNNNNNNNGGEQ